MKILLTGPTGFLGGALAAFWSRRGHELLLVARRSSDARRIGRLPRSASLVRLDGIGDLPEVVTNFGPEAIVHTACCYGRSGEDAQELLDVNLGFGSALLQAAQRSSTHRALFINTGTTLKQDVSLYALSKALFSSWGAGLAMHSRSAPRFVDVRLQQMYGPGDSSTKFTTQVIETCVANTPRLALTAGDQVRDFIYIDDVVSAYDAILQRNAEFSDSDVIDVGSGSGVRMRDFVELAKRLSGSTTELDFGAVAYRRNEAMYCVADISRLTSLGWRQDIDLPSGLRRTLAYVREAHSEHDSTTSAR